MIPGSLAKVLDAAAEEAIDNLVFVNDPAPALAALERARSAWARVYQQQSLAFCAVCGHLADDDEGCEFCPAPSR